MGVWTITVIECSVRLRWLVEDKLGRYCAVIGNSQRRWAQH